MKLTIKSKHKRVSIANPSLDIPNFQNTKIKIIPVKISTRGYIKEIFPLQYLHFPFNTRKLNTGILSNQGIDFSQIGQ